MVWSEAVPPHNSDTVGWATAQALVVGLSQSQRTEPNKQIPLLHENKSVWSNWKLNTHFLPNCLWKFSKWFPFSWCWFGTSPDCRFHRDLFLCLGRKKGSPPRCCRPETARPWGKASKETTVCSGLNSTATISAMPSLRRPAGGDLQGVGWWSLRGEKEACGRCCRSVRLSVFLVRYVWLIECYWNDLNSFTAENICAGWFSHSKYRLIHVCTKITRDLKSTKIWLFDVWLKCRSIVENLQRERDWFGQKLCNCRYWQLQLSNRMSFS